MRRVVLGLSMALLSATSVALAQQPSPPSDQDKALAARLFDEGHALLEQGNVPEACRKLEESRRLDPQPGGTILNLAACHEREGRTASAMAEFREARALAEHAQRDDRVAFCDEHLKAIEPKLSMLVVVVPPSADLPDLTIIRDGVAIGRAAWGEKIPVDPGPHAIEATAPHKQMRHVDVQVGPNADVQTVTIAALDDTAPEPAPPPAPAPATATTTAPAPESPAPPPSTGLSTRRQWALVSGGVGLAGVIAGSIAGIVAIEKNNDANSSKSTSAWSTAGTAADISTASFAVGLVGLGLGAFLWFGDAAVNVTPGVASVQVNGRF
ncbi:MAG TPA: tetratricopeptide repeat protein [Polyangiaceae bacterium]